MECTILFPSKLNIANPQFRKTNIHHSQNTKATCSESLINKCVNHFFLKIVYQKLFYYIKCLREINHIGPSFNDSMFSFIMLCYFVQLAVLSNSSIYIGFSITQQPSKHKMYVLNIGYSWKISTNIRVRQIAVLVLTK